MPFQLSTTPNAFYRFQLNVPLPTPEPGRPVTPLSAPVSPSRPESDLNDFVKTLLAELSDSEEEGNTDGNSSYGNNCDMPSPPNFVRSTASMHSQEGSGIAASNSSAESKASASDLSSAVQFFSLLRHLQYYRPHSIAHPRTAGPKRSLKICRMLMVAAINVPHVFVVGRFFILWEIRNKGQ